MNTGVDLRKEFPILSQTMHGQPLVYLDNASTTQKPWAVIEAEKHYYETLNANVHRGVYELSERATEAYTEAHTAVAKFLNANGPEEIIFTRNTTEGINLVVFTWGIGNIRKGDRVLLTAMEHHSNIVPWQVLARGGVTIDFVELTSDGQLDLDDLDRKLALKPKILSLTHISNVLGTVNPMQEIIRRAHAAGTVVVVDAAQSVPRMPIDVRALDADFLVFSGHKMYGPTGVGVVYGKRQILENTGPFLTGGDMVKTVSRESATWNDLPWKFEAGTPNIAGGVALGETVKFLQDVGMENVWEHEKKLVEYTLPKLMNIPGLKILGPTGIREQRTGNSTATNSSVHSPLSTVPSRSGTFSFTLEGLHSHDLASFLDERGIAIRGGHHCAQPLLASLGLQECARASIGLYTTESDIDALIEALRAAGKELS